MKKILPILFMLAIAVNQHSQAQESVPGAGGRNGSIHALILDGRQEILDGLRNGDTAKAAGIRDRIVDAAMNTQYRSFYGSEYFLLLFWTKDYERLSENAITGYWEPSNFRFDRMIINPPDDELAGTLPAMSAQALPLLTQSIAEAVPDAAKRDFLTLLLEWLTTRDDDYAARKDISERADRYLELHPATPYAEFITTRIRYRPRESDLALGASAGIGLIAPSSDMGAQLNPGFLFSGALDVFHRRLYAGVGLSVGVMGFKDKSGRNRMTVTGLGLNVGYKVLDVRRFAVVPYGSVGISGFASHIGNVPSGQENPRSVTWGVGVYSDLKLRKYNDALNLMTGKRVNYNSLRLRYQYSRSDYTTSMADNFILHRLCVEFAIFRHGLRRAGR